MTEKDKMNEFGTDVALCDAHVRTAAGIGGKEMATLSFVPSSFSSKNKRC